MSVSDYLNRLENEIISKKTSSSIHISDKKMNIFKYNRPISGARDEMVIPFGFMKSNTPYVEDQSDDFIATPSTDKLYDVNLLYYNEKDKIAILTLFKGAPSSKRICEILNSYISDSEYRLDDLIAILPYCNESFIYDNENGFAEKAECGNGRLVIKDKDIPEWLEELKRRCKHI